MHVGGGGTYTKECLGIGSTWRIHQWLDLSQLKHIVLSLGFKTYLALLNL